MKGVVRYDGVWFRYAPDQPWVLQGIDFEIPEGGTFALVGSSGAGKTTLASLLPRFYDVERGAVLVDGDDVRDIRLQDLRGAIGLVPQEPMLFAGTVRENLLYGNAGATEEEMIAWCRERLAHDKAPRRVVFTEVPKTSTCKVQKFKLREMARNA